MYQLLIVYFYNNLIIGTRIMWIAELLMISLLIDIHLVNLLINLLYFEILISNH